MPSRTQQRERRRERPEAERRGEAEAKRQRLIGAAVAGILLAATVAAVVLVTISGDDSGSADAEGTFGTHYEGLEERRLEAGVPTMSDSPAPGAAHIHPSLSVYASGEQIPIPVNIGIDPARPLEQMAGLHTHDQSGLIHVENAAEPTLGQFFAIWGVRFSADGLGPYEADGDQRVRMWVDGKPSEEFGDLVLEDGQEVVVAYGSDAQLPPGLR